MATIDDGPLSQGGKPGRAPRQVRVVRPVAVTRAVIRAVIVAIPVWLGACALMEDWPPPTAAGINPPAVEPAPGPIALAPSMTGGPAAVPSPVAAPARPLAPSRPLPPLPAPAAAVAMPAPPPAPSAAVVIPTFAPILCPPGAIAMWSEPDAAGTPVPICRRFHPSR
jgi:hypothetical protein